MNVDELDRRFPELWHVTFEGGWAGIRRHGLFPASELDPGSARTFRGEMRQRQASDGSVVVLRDQIRSRIDPTPYLDGVTVEEWWELVNRRVYFFCRDADCERLVESYHRRGHAQEVLKLRTGQLLREVASHVELTTVNAGVFPRTKGPSRGIGTFQRLDEFAGTDAPKIREITVAASRVRVPDAVVVKVVRRYQDGPNVRLFPEPVP